MRPAPQLSRLLALAAALAGCEPPDVPDPIATHVGDWRDEVIYQIVVDRFDDGDPSNSDADGITPDSTDLSRMQGGDWRGIRRRLDYVQALGATTIWISPPYTNVPRTEREDGYHGYWPRDFTEANERFGGMEELRALVRDAHARGMLVILDVVPNHAGRVFHYDLNANGDVDPGETEPPFADPPYDVPLLHTHRPRVWSGGARLTLEAEHYHRHGAGDLGDPRQKELADFPSGLRDLHTEREDVIEALVETHVWWVVQTDVDGFRVDAVPHAPRAFWAAFAGRLRRRLAALGKERFFLLGEVFDGSPDALASYTGLDALDANFAFDLKLELIDGVILEGRAPAGALGPLGGYRDRFPASGQPFGLGLSPWEARVAFADNHDVWRVRGELDDPLVVELAMTVVFTVDAIPSIYYGTEQDLDGTEHHLSREPLFRVAPAFDTTGTTFRYIARLAELRRASPALRYGALEVRYAARRGGRDAMGAPDAGLFAYERAHEGERVLVVVNAALAEAEATFATGFREGEALGDALGRASGRFAVGSRGQLTVRLPPRSSVVLTR
ncbi:MAG: hypothetical protein KF729_10465 [Sandaracinaceae bacterium]|nr:hypothetical protein [Sandaracinaceae bacterium]